MLFRSTYAVLTRLDPQARYGITADGAACPADPAAADEPACPADPAACSADPVRVAEPA